MPVVPHRLLAPVRLLTVVVLVGFAAFVARDFLRRHPENAPWTPLDLTAPVGWATAAKLAALSAHPAECRAVLAAAGIRFTAVPRHGIHFTAVPRRDDGPGCSLAEAGRVTGLPVAVVPAGAAMSCPLAAALAVWTRASVLPAAAANGDRATAITTFGTYNCRRIAGSDRPSEHATANAVDIAGIRLTHGDIRIARDWRDPGPRGVLARRLRDGACRLFAVTLSPDHNAAHRDHLHLDMGRGRVCD